MENTILVGDKDIPLVNHHHMDRGGNHDDDYNDYNTLNTTVEETTFTPPGSNDKQS